MIRIDLFHPAEPSIYGTATAMDIFQVCCAAVLFCSVTASVFLGAAYLLTKVAG